jgi:hypothetical protein
VKKSQFINVVLAAGLAIGAQGAVGAAKLYKWVDEKGQTHYTEAIPPEYKDKASTEIDKRGRVLRRNEAVAEQARLSEEEATRKRAEDKRIYEQKRRDTALLKTYTSEAEIDLARDRSLALPLQVMKGFEPRIKAAKQRLEGFRAQSEPFAKAGKPVPDALREDISGAEKDLVALEAEARAKQQEIDHIREKYAAEKMRYRELTAAASTERTAKNP